MSTVLIDSNDCTDENWQINLLKNKFDYKYKDLKSSQNEIINKHENFNYYNEVEEDIDQILGRKSRIDFNRKLKDDLLNSLASDQSKKTLKSLNTGQSVVATNNHTRLCLIQ